MDRSPATGGLDSIEWVVTAISTMQHNATRRNDMSERTEESCDLAPARVRRGGGSRIEPIDDIFAA